MNCLPEVKEKGPNIYVRQTMDCMHKLCIYFNIAKDATLRDRCNSNSNSNNQNKKKIYAYTFIATPIRVRLLWLSLKPNKYVQLDGSRQALHHVYGSTSSAITLHCAQ